MRTTTPTSCGSHLLMILFINPTFLFDFSFLDEPHSADSSLTSKSVDVSDNPLCENPDSPLVDSSTVPPTTSTNHVSSPSKPSPTAEPPVPCPELDSSSPIRHPTKGYAYVPPFNKAPKDINSDINTSNIVEGPRRRKAPVIHQHQANLIVGEPASLKDPHTYGEILGRLDELRWLMAIEFKLNNISQHKVWVVAPLTPGCKPLDNTWVFKQKFDADGELLKYKAPLCVQGFGQIEGINYNAIFAPTGRLSTLRLILGLAAPHDCDIQQMDVKCAFLNGIPEEDLFIKVPEGVGIELPDVHGLKLQKSLYGFKQSPRCWYRSLKH
ncbi:hypothetical protein PCASD_25631 [Puccinia coronata f. sp. avenae]|uniref:Reverse transcriptase Ty1/copia-type domain-containing protein n=1 Tax=Puccinia coronata f. sp. avenae TaxID=200324 RepID=A0A2N5THV4_9BASI|nr:hypothetical protein PCASD_25631 [Puccinia coronata f. sp. avenae]